MAADIFLDSVHDIVRKEGVRSAEAEVPKAASVGALEVRLAVCVCACVMCVFVCVCLFVRTCVRLSVRARECVCVQHGATCYNR